jgi:mutator protein MutT
LRVIASVIEREGRLLLCQRPPEKRHGGLWEFPGGKLEPGESAFDAASRELAEELGIRVTAVDDIEFSVNDPGSAFIIEFARVRIEGEPQCLEHSALAWVAPAELPDYALAPGDACYAAWRVANSASSPR